MFLSSPSHLPHQITVYVKTRGSRSWGGSRTNHKRALSLLVRAWRIPGPNADSVLALVRKVEIYASTSVLPWVVFRSPRAQDILCLLLPLPNGQPSSHEPMPPFHWHCRSHLPVYSGLCPIGHVHSRELCAVEIIVVCRCRQPHIPQRCS